ncbi:MAG: hypothetical protein IPP13_16810 [Kouleothrix sp.]|jgi:flavodoxin|nr:hypothetical protein [Kouleothrix sp.]
MKAMIIYASWFGHNRTIAHLLADTLRSRGMHVACAAAGSINPGELTGYDLLVLGTYTHHGRASHALRDLCAQIPQRQLQKLEIALYGTQTELFARRHPGGVDDLELCLANRGCDLVVPPLRLRLAGTTGFQPRQVLEPDECAQIEAFAAELWEASVLAPLI